MEPTPGVIIHKERAQQINDFSGLIRKRGITPTDIDGLIDYGGAAFIMFEGKCEWAKFSKGQRMAIENLITRLSKGGALAVCFVYSHKVPVQEMVDVSSQIVIESYFKGKWRDGKQQTVLEAIEAFEAHAINKGINL